MKKLLVLLFVCTQFCVVVFGQRNEVSTDGWTKIVNGQMWMDEDGRSVQAHGAGFVLVGDTWYMIGEDRATSWHPDVNMYSSKDLQHWKF